MEITPAWLRANHFAKRGGRWKRVIDSGAGGVTSLLVSETSLDIWPTWDVSLKQHCRLIFLTYTNDAEKLSRLVEALVALCACGGK